MRPTLLRRLWNICRYLHHNLKYTEDTWGDRPPEVRTTFHLVRGGVVTLVLLLLLLVVARQAHHPKGLTARNTKVYTAGEVLTAKDLNQIGAHYVRFRVNTLNTDSDSDSVFITGVVTRTWKRTE